MKNGRNFEVVKHGDLHGEAIICPECLKDIKDCDLVAREESETMEMVIFKDIYEVFTYKCPECGCEFQEKRQKSRSLDSVLAKKISIGVIAAACILCLAIGVGTLSLGIAAIGVGLLYVLLYLISR